MRMVCCYLELVDKIFSLQIQLLARRGYFKCELVCIASIQNFVVIGV